MVRKEAYPKTLMGDYQLIAELSNAELLRLRRRVAQEISKIFGDEETGILEI